MHITGIYVALAVLLVLLLAGRVIWLRNARKVALGDGGLPELARAIRAHANAVEYLPLALLLLLVIELDQVRADLVHGFGIVLLLARALHAWGLSRHSGRSFGRAVGIVLSWLVMLAMAALVLWRHLVLDSIGG
ncbi:MAPEG family protein [Dyella sp.]|jgi:hypothetical protein|uniref:MAPEG family protein n=1 Tax=Dyella sp. TaxID=1869338 RepID=UPI002D772371|nr:MAPEG family protein [Dyella sp.]HET6433640.1 MAPEG family protein [Dyella sp.]